MHQHLATLSWTPSALARRSAVPAVFVHPVRTTGTPPPWHDDTWSLICRFPSNAPLAPNSPVIVRFLVKEAPHDWLTPGARLYLFEGPAIAAIIDVGASVVSQAPPRPRWRTQVASDVAEDSLSLEVYDERDRLVAEVQRCDSLHDVRLYQAYPLPPDLQDWLVTEAELQLGPFQDGQLLPPPSGWTILPT